MTQPQEKKEFREVFLPSVDEEMRYQAYSTRDKAVEYAMKRASMSCGAIHFVEHAALVASQDEVTALKEKQADDEKHILNAHRHIAKIESENAELKRKLESAEDALMSIINSLGYVNMPTFSVELATKHFNKFPPKIGAES